VKIDEYEQKIAEIAIEKKFDIVICGHIHQPQKRIIKNKDGEVCYLNSGDWVDHMTALEYYEDDWHLFTYQYQSVEIEKPRNPTSPSNVLASEVYFQFNALIKNKR